MYTEDSLYDAAYEHTGSRLASSMLRDWSRFCAEFIKVMPIEYKKMLEVE